MLKFSLSFSGHKPDKTTIVHYPLSIAYNLSFSRPTSNASAS